MEKKEGGDRTERIQLRKTSIVLLGIKNGKSKSHMGKKDRWGGQWVCCFTAQGGGRQAQNPQKTGVKRWERGTKSVEAWVKEQLEKRGAGHTDLCMKKGQRAQKGLVVFFLKWG